MTLAIKPLDRILQDAADRHFRAQVDSLCELLTDKMRKLDRLKQTAPEVYMQGALPAQEWGRASARASLFAEKVGEINGLRQALCLLLGYEPDTDASHEGPADQYAMEWWYRNRSDIEWELAGD
jgi:hypothetical protein